MALNPKWKHAAAAVFDRAGGDRLARWVHRGRLRILAYHRFQNAGDLEFQCRYIARYSTPLSLTEAADLMRSPKPLPPNALVVTVDDGYHDFLESGHPVFSAFRIPVTVYLVTDFLERKLWLWPDRVRYAFLHACKASFAMQLPNGAAANFTLESEEQRRSAGEAAVKTMKLLDNRRRLRLLEELPGHLGLELPGDPPASFAPLTLQDARNLPKKGVEFGSHTRTHPILSRLSSPEDLLDEVVGSKRRLEELLGGPVRHFAYPNGEACDIGPAAIEAVRRAGYWTAVTMEQGLNAHASDPLLLRRIGVEPGYDQRYFKRRVAALTA